MAKFAYLLHHPPGRYDGLSEDDYLAIIKDYVAWVEETSAKGLYVGGHKLDTGSGKQLRAASDGLEVHDSPFTEASEVLGGLMIVEAKDMEAAVEMAKDHPHLRHNTHLEIRQIDDVE